MEARKVIQIKGSLYINVPWSVVEVLKLKRGDVLWIGNVSKEGLVATKSKTAGKVSAGVAGVERIKAAAEEAHRELVRQAKALQNSFVNNVMLRLSGISMQSSISDLKRITSDSAKRLKALEMKKKKV